MSDDSTDFLSHGCDTFAPWLRIAFSMDAIALAMRAAIAKCTIGGY
jgi:hypothetical protein